MTSFSLGAIDLGRAGQLIQAVVRARLEREREDAESAMRMARVQNDAELSPYLATIGDTALRYRQADMWRDLAQRSDGVTVAVPGSGGTVILPPELEAAIAAEATEEQLRMSTGRTSASRVGLLSDRFLEVVAVILLGIATVGTAWCGLQSALWNGEQDDLSNRLSDERIEANRLFGAAAQSMSYDAQHSGPVRHRDP